MTFFKKTMGVIACLLPLLCPVIGAAQMSAVSPVEQKTKRKYPKSLQIEIWKRNMNIEKDAWNEQYWNRETEMKGGMRDDEGGLPLAEIGTMRRAVYEEEEKVTKKLKLVAGFCREHNDSLILDITQLIQLYLIEGLHESDSSPLHSYLQME